MTLLLTGSIASNMRLLLTVALALKGYALLSIVLRREDSSYPQNENWESYKKLLDDALDQTSRHTIACVYARTQRCFSSSRPGGSSQR